MRLAALVLVLGGAGCAQLIGISDPEHATVDGDGSVIPATPDARMTADARTCGWPFVPARFDPCDPPDLNGETTLGDVVLDTDRGTIKDADLPATTLRGVERAQVGGLHIRIERWASLAVTGRLRVNGRLALILIVDGDLTIAAGGRIDVTPARDPDGESSPAAGGDDVDRCGDKGRGGDGAYGASHTAGSGGGGGGAFGGAGAAGGKGGSDNGGMGGPAGAVNGGDGVLRGGCRGGFVTGSSLVGSNGGFGGGAVQLSVKGKLIVEAGGSVDASGAGGQAAFTDFADIDGGGGGGSGGLIHIEASEVIVRGALCANGGGGAESHGAEGGQHGASGMCARAAAPGGATGAGGASGGNGGYRDHPDGEPGAPGFGIDGGGGGGGGVGRIRIRAVKPFVEEGGSVISPAPQI